MLRKSFRLKCASHHLFHFAFRYVQSQLKICNFGFMNEPINKPVFNKRIFWDVNFEVLDYDKSAVFVIERVFERGDVEDIRQSRRYYGDEKVTEVLLNAKYLPERRLHLAAAVINRSEERRVGKECRSR